MTTVHSIPIAQIDRDIANHRLVESEERIAELAASIAAHGLQQPIRVYKKPDGRYTLGFGFRRLAAHELLGHETIAAFVAAAASAADIRAAQAIENLYRQDLHPLEEAEVLAAIFGSDVLTITESEQVAECAAKIGRPRQWVENRLALLRLSPRVRQLLLDGQIYLGHAQLIARLADHAQQEEVAGHVKATKWAYGPRKGAMQPPSPLYDCRHLVEQRQRDLASAPWKLDAVFTAAPACAVCPKNSANTLGLFDDPAATAKKPQCLDGACFGEKAKAASNAMRRAVNEMVKTEAKPTAAMAAKAIAEREVEFLKPAPVAHAAKARRAPEKPTSSERRGEAMSSEWVEAMRVYNEALNEWAAGVNAKIEATLLADPLRVAVMILLSQTDLYDRSEFGSAMDQSQAFEELRALRAELLPAPTAATLERVARMDRCDDRIVKLTPSIHHWRGRNEEDDDRIVLAQALGIEIAPEPEPPPAAEEKATAPRRRRKTASV